MLSRPRLFIVINSSDLNTGMTFSFIQQQFNFLCSSIADYPVANAVMASSAVPGIFAPIAVRNFALDCRERRDSWVHNALRTRDIYSREYQVALALERYSEPARMPIVRLEDGGVTARVDDESRYALLDTVSRILVVVANAQTYEDFVWSKQGREPGLIENITASFDSAVGLTNSETVGLAERGFRQWADRVSRRPSRRGKPPVDLQFAVLTYDKIRDPAERRAFNEIPTTLSLEAEQVDRVRALAKRLLRESPEFQRFVARLQ